MALLKCRDCDGPLSDRAPICPNCGGPGPGADAAPARVLTEQANALTRNRGCADLLLFGVVGVPLLLLVFARACL